MADDKQITVEQDGQVLSQATVSSKDNNKEVRAQVHVASGHLPAGTHRKMAEALHKAVTKDNAEHLTVSVPRGGAELVEGIRDHLNEVEIRSAGSTGVVQARSTALLTTLQLSDATLDSPF